MRKSVRPDIIAQIGTGSKHDLIVLDTKWKIPGDGRPGDSDLHQMHSYNVQFGARRSLLLYPRVSAKCLTSEARSPRPNPHWTPSIIPAAWCSSNSSMGTSSAAISATISSRDSLSRDRQ